MENVYYENQGQNTYLVYKITSDDILDTVSLGMMTSNQIPGLADTIVIQVNNDKFIKYNVSRKISVKQFFNGSVNKKKFLGVFKGILKAMKSVQDYMIDTNSLEFDLDYVYIDVSSYETSMICTPFLNPKRQVDLIDFFRNTIFTMQFDQTENCSYIGKMINYLNSTSIFSIEEFKDIVLSIDEKDIQEVFSKRISDEKKYINKSEVKSVDKSQELKKDSELTISKTNESPRLQSKEVIADYNDDKNNVEDKKISLFYLMQHYNKENLERYRASKKLGKKKISQVKVKSDSTPSVQFEIPGVKKIENNNNMPIFNSNEDNENKVSYSSNQNSAVKVSNKTVNRENSMNSANFGDTVYYNDYNSSFDTIMIENDDAKTDIKDKKAYLIRQFNNEKIEIKSPLFIIGKEKSYVDYCINNNSAISRSHARILCRDEKYFVVDTNSTNHTFINGKMITNNDEVQIENGTEIRFANENFTFCIE